MSTVDNRISSRPGTWSARTQPTPSSTPQAPAQRSAAQPTAPARAKDGFEGAARAGQSWGSNAAGASASVTGALAKKETTKLPADLQSKVGTLDYYKARHDDFVQRHPGKTPPDYYLGYGDKYAHRFLEKTASKLSPEGKAWLDRTFQALQQKMEDLRKKDPAAFDRLEQDPDAFRKFAYGTHPDAYVESGLSKLPPKDLLAVAGTPDIKDLLTKDGISQVVETGLRVSKQWAGSAIDAGKDWATGKVKDAAGWAKDRWNDIKSIF